MSRDFSTDAVVLGSRRLREADRIVTLFTLDSGKTDTVVKGVRKIGSRFGGRLEPFTHLKVQLHAGRSLHTLTGADTICTHAAARDDPAALRAGLSFINLLARETNGLERRPRTYNLLVRFLGELDRAARTGAGAAAFPLLAISAELKLLLLAGYLPHLSECSVCGAPLTAPAIFSAEAGGVLCDACPGNSFVMPARAINAMRLLLEQPLAAAGVADPADAGEMWRAIREICRYHLGVNLIVAPL